MMRFKVLSLLVMTIVVPGFLSGCNFLPQAGPKYRALIERPPDSAVATTNFELVPINGMVAEETRLSTSRSLGGGFISAPEIELDRLRRGDVVSIAIWEPVAGLFQATAGRESLPNQVIDERGELFVPFVGTVKAAGLQVRQLRALLEERLGRQTPGP
jgi:polysaccharide biosynthesis/export protein